MRGPDEYTKPCPADGVEHDCTNNYIMWWNREDFDRWLAAHDDEVFADGYGAGARP